MPYQNTLPAAGERTVTVPLEAFEAVGTLAWPEHPCALVLLAQGRVDRPGPVERDVARELRHGGLATLHLDLLPRAEGSRRGGELEILAARVLAAARWTREQPELEELNVGLLGIGTGAAAVLRAAGMSDRSIGAVVGLGGDPDLAGETLEAVRVPTLLITAGGDHETLEPNRRAFRRLDCIKRLLVLDPARRLDEPGMPAEAARRAAGWLVEYLAMEPRWRRKEERCGVGV